MRQKWLSLLTTSGLCIAGTLGSVEAPAQQPVDPDWPCVQVLVPVVPAAVIWDGPAVDDLQQKWRQIPDLEQLVLRITAAGADRQTLDHDIERFAASLPPQRRNPMLTMLFAGVLETLNQDRSLLIGGIKRFARGQEARARKLDEVLAELVRLEEEGGSAAMQRHRQLQKRIELEQRIFDEREDSIEYLCSRPVAVEQRLGYLARTISGYLD